MKNSNININKATLDNSSGTTSGTTMVGVIVGLVVLVIMVGMFTGVVQFTHKMSVEADNVRNRAQTLANSFYLEQLTSQLVAGDGAGGETFVLTDGVDTINVDTSLFRYKADDDDLTVYTFGEYELVHEPEPTPEP